MAGKAVQLSSAGGGPREIVSMGGCAATAVSEPRGPQGMGRNVAAARGAGSDLHMWCGRLRSSGSCAVWRGSSDWWEGWQAGGIDGSAALAMGG